MTRANLQRKVNDTGLKLEAKLCATKEDVIKEITSKEYRHLARKIAWGNDLYEDLYQEMLLVVLEYPEDYILRIYGAGSIKWFVIGIMVKMYRSTTSQFHKKYKPCPQADAAADEYDHDTDRKIAEVKAMLSEMPWYDAMLFEAYVAEGSLRKLTKKTRIPLKTIQDTVVKVRNRVKEKMNEKDTHSRQADHRG